MVESPLDEVNRPRGGTSSRLRIPPSEREIDKLFTGWRTDMLTARKYAPAARNYTAMRLASLIGPRVSELCLLTMRRRVLGPWPVREDPAARQGQPRPGEERPAGAADQRVPGPAGMVVLRAAVGVRRPGQRPGRPAVPLRAAARRRLQPPGHRRRAAAGLAEAVAAHLPGQAGRLTPHLLRHYAASELYRNGMDVFAVQEVLGHEWINTTMIYVHVHRSHVEDAWVQAGHRAAGRLGGEPP